MGPTINLLILNVMSLLCTHNCYSAPNPNILTIYLALENLEYVLFFKVIHCLFAKIVTFFLILIDKKKTCNGETSGRRIT